MKYLFVFFLLPLFPISIYIFLLRNNICYTYLRIYSRLLSNSNSISFSPRCTPSFIHSRFSFTPSVLLIFPLFSSSLFPPPYSLLIPPFDTFSLFFSSVQFYSSTRIFLFSFLLIFVHTTHLLFFPVQLAINFCFHFSFPSPRINKQYSFLLPRFKKIRKPFPNVHAFLRRFFQIYMRFFTVSTLASIDPSLSLFLLSLHLFSRFRFIRSRTRAKC